MADGTYKPGPVVSLSLPRGRIDHYIVYGLPDWINQLHQNNGKQKKNQQDIHKDFIPYIYDVSYITYKILNI